MTLQLKQLLHQVRLLKIPWGSVIDFDYRKIIWTGCNTILSSPSGTFQSPNYPGYYPPNSNVCWLINGQDYVAISFPDVYTEVNQDFVRIYNGDSISSPLLLETSGGPYDGYVNQSVASSTNQMLVIFTSNNATTYRGFNATYSSCTVLTSSNGSISTPNYPGLYNNYDSVCWAISRPVGFQVTLSFNTFQTESPYDVVRIYDGTSTNSPQLLSASGTTLPSAVTSSSNQMLIFFTSDSSAVRLGFQATFNSVFLGWRLRGTCVNMWF